MQAESVANQASSRLDLDMLDAMALLARETGLVVHHIGPRGPGVFEHAQEIVGELREVLQQGNRAAKSRNVDDLVRLNGEFHDKLAEAGRNSILWDIMRTLRERTSLVFAANTAGRAQQDWDEHSKILAAVIDGDEDLAAMLATRHVRRAADAAFAAQASRA